MGTEMYMGLLNGAFHKGFIPWTNYEKRTQGKMRKKASIKIRTPKL